LNCNTKIFRNKKKQIIGYLETDSKGRKILRDKSKNIIAYYYPLINMSKDRFHNNIGEGDLLKPALIRKLNAEYKRIDKIHEGFGNMVEFLPDDY
jgi:hypothetical protein